MFFFSVEECVFSDVGAEFFRGLYYSTEFCVSRDSDDFTRDSSVKHGFYYK